MANTKTLISVKIDKSLKKAAQDLVEEIGIPLGTLINIFLKQFVRNKEVIFSVTYKPTPYLMKIIEEAEKELAGGKVPPPVSSVEELVKELRS
jgi:addiction module RelB/DinJ family antitoxin